MACAKASHSFERKQAVEHYPIEHSVMAALTGKLNEGDDPAAIKIILFYQYFPQSLVDALGAEGDHAPLYQELYNYQLEQCSALGLLGRVLISTQGINGTLSGTVEQIGRYIELMGVYS